MEQATHVTKSVPPLCIRVADRETEGYRTRQRIHIPKRKS